MPAPVLVTYATRYGSTQEVAEAIVATLRERSLEVDVLPMSRVDTLEGRRAVVLGTPLYIGHWLKDTNGFLTRHRESLASRPVAVFALGPTIDPNSETERQGARAQLDAELAKVPWLAPVAVEMFGGKYDPAKLRFADKLVTSPPASPLHGLGARDDRDWAAIQAWTDAVAESLRTGTAQTT
jgi:menaquinone-dependent protoporphyrinogen oxidase